MRLLFSRGQESRRPRPMSLVLARVRVLFARARGRFLSDSKNQANCQLCRRAMAVISGAPLWVRRYNIKLPPSVLPVQLPDALSAILCTRAHRAQRIPSLFRPFLQSLFV